MLRLAFERSRDDLIHELGGQLILDYGEGPMTSWTQALPLDWSPEPLRTGVDASSRHGSFLAENGFVVRLHRLAIREMQALPQV